MPALTDEEIHKLLKAASAQPDPFVARRDEAMVRMLTDAGVRISELCTTQLADLDLDGGAVWVTGKGGRRRLVHFGARTTRGRERPLVWLLLASTLLRQRPVPTPRPGRVALEPARVSLGHRAADFASRSIEAWRRPMSRAPHRFTPR